VYMAIIAKKPIIRMESYNGVITEYFTTSHSEPLVIVPRMGLAYLKGCDGYHTRFLFQVDFQESLENIISKGGDFVMSLTEVGSVVLSFTNAFGSLCACISPWKHAWGEWWGSLVKMQKRLKYIMWKRHRYRVKNMKTFLESDMAKLLSLDIIANITTAYFQHSTNSPSKKGQKMQTIRTMETEHFKLQKSLVSS
jgi:hypothetical protein